ncbi:alpha-E domain-containing protein, partial [Thiomonas sp.]|uniref:alpha-E domain-containing protein n=1 Tax=Thiomonas sp. TaxID=2047785 RepID=UPI0026222F7E
MLSRTADHLFWMARYTERAENTARMLDVHVQSALLRPSAEADSEGWASVLGISELTADFVARHGDINAENVQGLRIAWQWKHWETPLKEYETTPGQFESTPLMIDGVLYV